MTRKPALRTKTKVINVSDTKRIDVEGIVIGGEPYISVRTFVYRKKYDAFVPAKGMTIPLEHAQDVARAVGITARDADPATFRTIQSED